MLKIGLNCNINKNEILNDTNKYIFLIHSYIVDETWLNDDDNTEYIFSSEQELEKFVNKRAEELNFNVKLHKIINLQSYSYPGNIYPEVLFITTKYMTLREFFDSDEFECLSIEVKDELITDGINILHILE